MINVFKEESPKGHFKLIRKPSCDMMNAHFWLKIHTLNPLAHWRPPYFPNCLAYKDDSFDLSDSFFFFFTLEHICNYTFLNKLWALVLMMFDQYESLTLMKRKTACVYCVVPFEVSQHVDFLCLKIMKQSKSCNYLRQSVFFFFLFFLFLYIRHNGSFTPVPSHSSGSVWHDINTYIIHRAEPTLNTSLEVHLW